MRAVVQLGKYLSHGVRNFSMCPPEMWKFSMSSRRPRWAPILIVVGLAMAAIVAVHSVREPILRAAGWALVVNEPLAPADVIVVSLDSGEAGALEAADLVQSGIAKRVAVFADSPSAAISRVHPPGAPLRGCKRKTDSATEVAWRNGCHANSRDRQWNRGWRPSASVMVRPESVPIRCVCGR